jgi:hypothetical protein
MKEQIGFVTMGVCALALLLHCGSSSTTTTATTSTTQNAASAVGAVFGSSSSSSISRDVLEMLAQLVVKQATAQESNSTCDNVSESPGNVTSTATGAAGSHGAASDQVTVTADGSFCTQSDGSTANTNTDNLLFASFTLASATVTCGSDSLTMTGTGVYRNRPDLTPALYPQIYGAFVIDGETVDCSIGLGESENVLSSACTDSGGTAVDVISTTCSIDAS